MKQVTRKKYLRTKEFEQIYPLNRNTLYKWLHAGVIKGFILNGLWFIPESEVERLKLQAKTK